MRRLIAVFFTVALLGATVPATAGAKGNGNGFGNIGKATAHCNLGVTLGGSLICLIPK